MKERYTFSDIKWIKHVSNSELGSAYMDEDFIFTLHFPNKHGDNLLQPKIGEIILLYQNIKGKRVLTHLVSPIDDLKIPENDREHFKFGRRVMTVAKMPQDKLILVSDTLWKSVKFSGISQGNACKIHNVKSVTQLDKLLLDTWKRFGQYLCDNIGVVDNLYISESGELYEGAEGDRKLISHYVRERDSKIVRIKKESALAENKLYCCVCNFSFTEVFGVEFIECHHLTPIAETGETLTRLEDLVLVCPCMSSN